MSSIPKLNLEKTTSTNETTCSVVNKIVGWSTVRLLGIQVQLSHARFERRSVQQTLTLFMRPADFSTIHISSSQPCVENMRKQHPNQCFEDRTSLLGLQLISQARHLQPPQLRTEPAVRAWPQSWLRRTAQRASRRISQEKQISQARSLRPRKKQIAD